MPDNDAPLSREQMNRFMVAIKEPHREHEKEKRRSIEISAGFFEKLSALSAGSIAVSASIILAIAVRSDFHSGSIRIVIHHLLLIATFLWVSLIFAILHNFLAAQVAKLDAAISESQFLWTIMTQSFSLAQETMPTIDDATMTKMEDMVRAVMSPKESKRVKCREFLYPCVNWVGYLSMLAFLTAFTLVMFYLRQLW